jgi:hypothetical protein
VKLNETEKKVLKAIAERCSDSLGNAGCNDEEIPATPEGEALYRESISDRDPEDIEDSVRRGKKLGRFIGTDFVLFDRLLKKALQD